MAWWDVGLSIDALLDDRERSRINVERSAAVQEMIAQSEDPLLEGSQLQRQHQQQQQQQARRSQQEERQELKEAYHRPRRASIAQNCKSGPGRLSRRGGSSRDVTAQPPSAVPLPALQEEGAVAETVLDC